LLFRYYFKDARLKTAKQNLLHMLTYVHYNVPIFKYTVKAITGSRPKMGLYPISETLENCYCQSVTLFINRCQKISENHSGHVPIYINELFY